MKKLDEYINGRFVSLKDIDEEYADKIKNLQGAQINECCGCCDCGCDAKCCAPCDIDACDQAFRQYFYSEREIVEKLKTTVTAQDLFNLHSQFSYNRFALIPPENDMPLIFTEKLMLPSGEQMEGRSYVNNNKLIDLIRKAELNETIVLVRLDNSIQVFGLKYTGTNGKEGSIKNSLIEVAKKLTTLEKIPEIKWAQVLDVSIDNADDVYTFVITFTCNSNDIPENPQDTTGLQPIPVNFKK